MQTAARDIIVLDQREHLRFISVPIIIGAVHYLVNIVDKGRPPDASAVLFQAVTPGNV